jgi:hypothetical protein
LRSLRVLSTFAVLGLGLSAAAAPPPAPAPRLVITGTRLLPAEIARKAAGPPSAELGWGEGATRRIAEAYKSREYHYARAWFRRQRDGTLRIHVDEGEVRVIFTGVSSFTAFFLRLGLNLPHDVYHKPTVERALDGLKRTHDLSNLYHRVKETDQFEITPLGEAVHQRVLQVFAVTRELTGCGLDVVMNAAWGMLLQVSFSRVGLLFEGDWFRVAAVAAFPYRRYLFEEDAKFQWVHGGVELGYRAPKIFGRRVAPRLDASSFVSQLDRADLGLSSYHALRVIAIGSISLFLGAPVELRLGGGIDTLRLFAVEQLPSSTLDPALLEQTGTVRGLARISLHLEQSAELLRRDWRRFLWLRLDLGSSQEQEWLLSFEAQGQVFLGRGRHRCFARLRSVLLGGEVRFWDDVPLAGDFQRVFFGNRYWVRETAQLELAYRIGIWSDWLDLGIFHDLSVFADRTRPGRPAAVVNGFGPSLHLLGWDLFSFDFYLGFGFAPEIGFDHTFSFSVQTIF